MTVERSAEEKAGALAVYAERGLAAAHHATGVPRSTIHRWAQAAGLDLPAIAARSVEQTAAATAAHEARCAELRVELREKFLLEAGAALDRMSIPYVEFVGSGAVEVEYPLPPAGALFGLMKTAGTALDKYRLEVGEATSRDEHHVSDVRERASAILDELAQRRVVAS